MLRKIFLAWKSWGGIIFALGFLVLTIPHKTQACLTPTCWIKGAIEWFLNLFVLPLAGLVIAVEAWAFQIILQINTQIVNSPLVKYGFPVSLSLVNLGFVLGVVVIAIATILRLQSYGLKQVLWRLLVMAIVINFGLVIAGTILKTSDSITFYFLSSINPGSSDMAYQNFTDAFAGAFAPQKAFIQGGGASAADAQKVESGRLISVIFVIFFLFLIILTLGAAVVMLIVRYVYLGYLLILLPFTWASWVFPATRGTWSKWWSNFLNQVFFPVFMMFFLWLAIMVSQKIGPEVQQFQSADSGTAWGSITTAISSFLANSIILPLLQGSVVIGIAMAGLFAAQSMGAKSAGGVISTFNTTAANFGNWAKRNTVGRGQSVATRTGSKVGGMATSWLRSQKMQERLARLSRVPVVGRLGTGLEKVGKGGQELALGRAREDIKAETDSLVLAHKFNRLNDYQKVATMERLQKEGNLHMVNAKDLREFTSDKNEQFFQRYGLGKLQGEIRNERGFTLLDLIEKRGKLNPKTNLPYTRQDIINHLKSNPNVAKLAETYMQSDEGLQKMEQAGGLGFAQSKEIQAQILQAMVGTSASEKDSTGRDLTDNGLTGNQISSILTTLSRGDQLDAFKSAAQYAAAKGMGLNNAANWSQQIHNFITNSPGAKNLVVNQNTFLP